MDTSTRSTLGCLLRSIRRDHQLSQCEFGAALGVCAGTIGNYERDIYLPPFAFVYDLFDGFPMPQPEFADLAARFYDRRLPSIDPEDHLSIHDYVAGVRTAFGLSRAVFAATLGCSHTTIYLVEHRHKPTELFMRRLVRRHLSPSLSYADLVRRFRTLRPSGDDLRCRAQFAELRAHEPGSTPWRRIRDGIIIDSLDLAHRFGRRVNSRVLSREDRDQAAAEALIRAVDGHQPMLGDFIPYLRKNVAVAIRGALRANWLTGTAADAGPHAWKIIQAKESLRHDLHREPSPAEIGTELGLPAHVVAHTLQALAARHCLALDRPNSDDRPRSDLGSADAGFERVELASGLRLLLASLGPDERVVLTMHFMEERSVEEIAARRGTSPDHISALLAGALSRLRASVDAPCPPPHGE